MKTQALLLETSTGGVVLARYTNRPDTWGGLASQNRSGISSFYGFDSQQCARILVSTGGLITDSYSWKAFGEPIQTSSGTVNPYGYIANGLYYTELADLINAWNRWLKSSVGRWDSRDPIGFVISRRSDYSYIDNSPLLSTDPSGLQPGLDIATHCSGGAPANSNGVVKHPSACAVAICLAAVKLVHGIDDTSAAMCGTTPIACNDTQICLWYHGAESCPAVARYGYAMNAKLSCVPLSSIELPDYLVVLFETNDLERNAAGVERDMAKPRHVACNIALQNGHVAWVNQYWLTNAKWSVAPRVGNGGK